MGPEIQSADASLRGKLRRRGARLLERRPLRGNPRMPIVSFTFDDAPESAAAAGAQALESLGLRGTFYVSVALCGQDGPMGRYATGDDVRRLARAGHEIGCHTYSHLECGPADPERIMREVEVNAASLAELSGRAPDTFAYPLGDVSHEAKRALSSRFRLLRALHPGLLRRGSDLNQAPSVPVDGPHGEARAEHWIDLAARTGGWLILCLHDVADPPSPWGCAPDALGRLVRRARGLGCEILPVSSALDRLEPAA